MDWNGTIETNRAALLRVVAELFAMIGWAMDGGDGGRPIFRTLPRAAYFAVLRLLLPAESALRRLIVMAARGIVVTLKARVGGFSRKTAKARPAAVPAFPLTDPLVDPRARAAGSARPATPRIRSLDFGPPLVATLFGRPKTALRRFTPLERFLPGEAGRGDPFASVSLCRRLLALKAALDDLPGQALRMARWQARRDRALMQETVKFRRYAALRYGPPPGYRAKLGLPHSQHDDERHALNDILADCHDLARQALEHDDSS